MGYRHRTTVCAAAMVLALPLMDEAAAAARRSPEPAAPAVRQDRVNPHAAEVAALQKRLDEYLKLHERVAGELPPLEESAEPAEIKGRERQLGEAIRRARADASSGDVFGEPLRDFYVRIIRTDWMRRPQEDRDAILKELPGLTPLGVNDVYPSAQPLATFPPKLLQQLPRLPDGLEYRLYGDDLIIRDTKANIVVDLLPDVLPAGTTSGPARESPGRGA